MTNGGVGIAAPFFLFDFADDPGGAFQRFDDVLDVRSFSRRNFLLSTFCPCHWAKRALNDGGKRPSNCAVSDQYSTGSKARISRSRSQTRRTATDCTRPALKPRRTFFHSSGLILIADQAVQHAARHLRVEFVAVELLRIGDRFLHRFLGDLVDQHAMHVLVIFRDLTGDMPGDRLAFAVGVGGQVDIFFALGGFLEIVDDFFLGLNNVKIRREIFFDIDAELALRQIDDVAHRRFDLKIASQILFQGLRLGGRFNDD